jgi:hypothetical protein
VGKKGETLPPVRQQLLNLIRPLRRQPRQHIFEVGIRIMTIQPRRLD